MTNLTYFRRVVRDAYSDTSSSQGDITPQTSQPHTRENSSLYPGSVEFLDPALSLLLGLWGGAGGSYWSFNKDGLSIIKQIVIYHGVSIDSIAFKNERGHKKKFGGSGGTRSQIDFGPNEYLTSISGHHGGYVNSLKLVTNIGEYGPYGPQEGSYFEMQMQGGTIAGFHGRSGKMLDAFGVYNKKNVEGGTTAAGILFTSVYGGSGGNKWIFNESGKATIKQIVISHGFYIDAITFKHDLNGKTGSSTFGGPGGMKSTIDFEPHEYLTSVSGYASGDRKVYVIGLKLVTNVKEYGPYGHEYGCPFIFTQPGKHWKIVGFHGRSGLYTDALGVYFAPRNGKYIDAMGVDITPVRPPCDVVGPWGGPGGDVNWAVNESGDGIIKQIIISKGSNSESFSLKFKLEVNGVDEYSQDYGASGSIKEQIDLALPQEYLTRITGYQGFTLGKDHFIIRSLTFFTNMGEYGPYGREEGAYFTSHTGKIVGVFGRSGTLLDAVGVYMTQA